MLLQDASIDFVTIHTQADETHLPDECPFDYLRQMCQLKAQGAHIPSGACGHLLTADTICILDGTILTKPKDRADAFAMWRNMSGRMHLVATGILVGRLKGGKCIDNQVGIATTCVHFKTITSEMMHAYWRTQEPRDKAGAYAIQGSGRAFVNKIEGDLDTVIGLPLALLYQLLGVVRD